jgi:nitronate monooxygenase
MHVLAERLGVELPIVQAPMAGVQGGRLAAAVSIAGGLGSIPCAMLDANGVRRELAIARDASWSAYNLNFFCHEPPAPNAEREARWRAALEPYYRELGVASDAATATGPARAPFDETSAALVKELGAAVVSFHFGLPSPELLARVREAGAMILASATTVDEARWLESRGVDGIIAQGAEAGGHRGMFLSSDVSTQIGTFALVRQVVQAVRVPVIAAGGIADAQGVDAALALGASAAQVGTTFLLCPEATTSELHRAALASDAARETALTNVFTGRPARGIVNRIMRELGPMSPLAPEFPLAAAALAPLRTVAEREGRSDFSPLWSGQNASGCTTRPAGEVTRALTLRR